MMTNIQVENPREISAKVMADSIQAIAEAMKRINQTRLTRRALVVLIHDQSGVGKKDIELVLNNLDQLGKTWLKNA